MTIFASVFVRADTIPPPVFEITSTGGPTLSQPGTSSGTACNGGPQGGCESSSAELIYSAGLLSGYAYGTASGGKATPGAGAQSYGAFFFEVVGPSGVEVPLIFSASGATTASGPDTTSSVTAETSGVNFYACSASGSAGGCGGEPASFSGSQFFLLPSNSLSDVIVIDSGEAGSGTGSFSAVSDPMITIDPTFADASKFTLEFSAAPGDTGGGGGSSPVPEPSTFTLLGTGLLALSGTMRRSLSRRGYIGLK